MHRSSTAENRFTKHHAVEFAASSGDLKDVHFLVIDINGIAA